MTFLLVIKRVPWKFFKYFDFFPEGTDQQEENDLGDAPENEHTSDEDFGI